MIYIVVSIFISFFTSTLPCSPPHPYPVKRQDTPIEDVTDVTTESCNFSLISPKKIINPYRQAIDNRVEPKPFNTFWLKCAACLAVANEVGKTMKGAIQMLDDNKNTEASVSVSDNLFEKKFAELCISGFKNYNLRKHNEVTLITNRVQCTEHVNTKMDGNWTKKLRELCNLYTLYMDIGYIANNYVNRTEELSTYLCKGTGIFRDCGNMEIIDLAKSIKQLDCCEKNQCC